MSIPFEDAQRCPKCKQPGEVMKEENRPRGKKEVTIYCRTKRCKWVNTPWVVTVNEDGTVPDPQDHRGKEKVYVGFEDHDRIAAQIKQAIEADEATAIRGGEIRRRR